MTIGDDSVPALGTGVKFRFDAVRNAWVVLAPERMFVPDESATEILRRVDGRRTIGTIVDELVAAYQAPRDVIGTDVRAMRTDLADKGVVRFSVAPA